MAAAVLAGMGATERVLTGERPESSQPAKSPQTGVNSHKAKNWFANDLYNIDRSLDGSIGTAKKQTILSRHPCSKVTKGFF
jgi:hypothetical protein